MTMTTLSKIVRGGGTLLPLLKSKMECGLVLAALF